jgi:RNA polymerase subunit RPABC4/transcription elongation factor Spt4
MEDLIRNVEMICPICGSKRFIYDSEDNNKPVTCENCKRFFTKEELKK